MRVVVLIVFGLMASLAVKFIFDMNTLAGFAALAVAMFSFIAGQLTEGL